MENEQINLAALASYFADLPSGVNRDKKVSYQTARLHVRKPNKCEKGLALF